MPEPAQTVLVVSGDPDFTAEIAYGFPQGIDVSFARDAREAAAVMKETIPSVVVVDIQAGSAGGFGLSREMDASDELRGVPRLVLLDRPQDAWLARQARATEFRVKPVESGELVATALALASSPSTPS